MSTDSNIPFKSDDVLLYNITYRTYTPESLEAGDTDDAGYHIEETEEEVSEIIREASPAFGVGATTPVSIGVWESETPVEDDDHFRKGIDRYYTVEVKHTDGSRLTEEEHEFLTEKILKGERDFSDGVYRLEDYLSDYAVLGQQNPYEKGGAYRVEIIDNEGSDFYDIWGESEELIREDIVPMLGDEQALEIKKLSDDEFADGGKIPTDTDEYKNLVYESLTKDLNIDSEQALNMLDNREGVIRLTLSDGKPLNPKITAKVILNAERGNANPSGRKISFGEFMKSGNFDVNVPSGTYEIEVSKETGEPKYAIKQGDDRRLSWKREELKPYEDDIYNYAMVRSTKDWMKSKKDGVEPSYNNPENDTHVLHIDGQTWYLEKIDSTHFYMSNDPNFRGMAHHVGQHKGKPYYEEVKSWLKDTYAGGGEISQHDKMIAEGYGISLEPSEFDGSPMVVWEMEEARGKDFGNWETAMRWLQDKWRSDVDLYDYFRNNLSSDDDLILGDQEFAGADVQDHMNLKDDEFYQSGGSTYEGGGEIEWFNLGVTKNPDRGSVNFRALETYGYEPRYSEIGEGYWALEIPMKHKERYKKIGLQHPYDRNVKGGSTYEGGGEIKEGNVVKYNGYQYIVHSVESNGKLNLHNPYKGYMMEYLIDPKDVEFESALPFEQGGSTYEGGGEMDKNNFESMSQEELLTYAEKNDIPHAKGWSKEFLIGIINDSLASRYDKDEFSKGGSTNDWQEEALQLLREEQSDFSFDIEEDEGTHFHAENDGGEEYIVFQNEGEAREYAINRVREDLENEPYLFNQNWLNSQIDKDKAEALFSEIYQEMNESYAREILTESGSNYESRLIDEMVEEGIMDEEEAESDDAMEIAEDRIDTFAEGMTESQIEQGEGGLSYYRDNFGEENVQLLMKEHDLIDYDSASKEAVNTDGIAHFLAHYDGEEIDLDEYVAYRTN